VAPEYLETRCCMCPNRKNPPFMVCPGVPDSPHPAPDSCRFVKVYVDEHGGEYSVQPRYGAEMWKAFYRRPGKKKHAGQPVWAAWRKRFDDAQADLNAEAKRRGWAEVSPPALPTDPEHYFAEVRGPLL
jgi:hypothetical protein